MKYEIYMGNVGKVAETDNGAQANIEYGQAKNMAGRATGETVTLFKDGEPIREYTPPPLWFFEYTDTYGGEANYCWVERFKVSAPTMHAALRKVSKHLGTVGRLKPRGCDRGDVRGSCTCIFGMEFTGENYSRMVKL